MSNTGTALVLGMGASGTAAARLLRRDGIAVTVVDRAGGTALERRATELRSLGAEAVVGTDVLPPGRFDICVVSPGIPVGSAWLAEADQRCGEVVSELELGARACRCPMVAVTGSNGKSTMVKLCTQALARAGFRVAAGGNYGPPLSDLAECGPKLDWAVVEVSSFQLERVRLLHPRVGVLLNVQPDHLDRHGDMAAYRGLKARLFARMRTGDTAVVHDGELDAVRSPAGGGPSWVSFGTSPRADFRYAGGEVSFDAGGPRQIDLRGTAFANPVMGATAAAATAVVTACGGAAETVAGAAREYRPLPHRMNEVAVAGGVRFVDDSKATNLAAMAAALDMTPGRVLLIAGGRLKERDLERVKESLAKRVGAVYLIGEGSGELADAWRDAVDCVPCGDLETAVRAAWRDAEGMVTVLLSPGCASFDQYRDFAQRGEEFTRLVEEIAEEDTQ